MLKDGAMLRLCGLGCQCSMDFSAAMRTLVRSHQLPPVGRVRQRSALEPGSPRPARREEAAAHGVLAPLRIERVNGHHQSLVQFVQRSVPQPPRRPVGADLNFPMKKDFALPIPVSPSHPSAALLSL
jgi:hypothetical protein